MATDLARQGEAQAPSEDGAHSLLWSAGCTRARACMGVLRNDKTQPPSANGSGLPVCAVVLLFSVGPDLTLSPFVWRMLVVAAAPSMHLAAGGWFHSFQQWWLHLGRCVPSCCKYWTSMKHCAPSMLVHSSMYAPCAGVCTWCIWPIAVLSCEC
jgi:hypothetical protein